MILLKVCALVVMWKISLLFPKQARGTISDLGTSLNDLHFKEADLFFHQC